MKKLLIFFLVSIVICVPHLSSISLVKYIEQNGMPHIQNGKLDLSDKNLTDLTGLPAIPGIDKITMLNLSNNRLQTIPDTIFNGLQSLQSLDLSRNHLRKLPAGVFNDLQNLEILSLRNNRLHIVPENIFNGLVNLVSLELNNNKLTVLPETVFNGLDNLEMLSLQNNAFELEFIPTLADILRTIPGLTCLNSKSKDQALRERPFSMLKYSVASYIVKHLDSYGDRLHELPADIINLLPLTKWQKIMVEKKRAAAHQ